MKQFKQAEQKHQQQLKAQCILTFGLSSHGKSSLINTICREKICEVGKYGQLCTKQIDTFSAKKVEDQIFNFIDLPGLVDSSCLYDNEVYRNQKIAQLQYILVSLDDENPNIKAILIVLSLEGSCQLTKCVNEIKTFLKNSSKVEVDKSNIILVLTKWQNMTEEYFKGYLAANSFQGFTYIKWTNDIYNELGQLTFQVPQDDYNDQLIQLLLKIKNCQSYTLGIPSAVQKNVDIFFEKYRKDENLYMLHKQELGKTLSKTERIRSWIHQHSALSTVTGAAGGLLCSILYGTHGVSASVISGSSLLCTGLIYQGITKPSEQEYKYLAKLYTYFQIKQLMGVNDK